MAGAVGSNTGIFQITLYPVTQLAVPERLAIVVQEQSWLVDIEQPLRADLVDGTGKPASGALAQGQQSILAAFALADKQGQVGQLQAAQLGPAK